VFLQADFRELQIFDAPFEEHHDQLGGTCRHNALLQIFVSETVIFIIHFFDLAMLLFFADLPHQEPKRELIYEACEFRVDRAVSMAENLL
jgi:hypothetical protein